MSSFADRGGWWVAGQTVLFALVAVGALVGAGSLELPAAVRWIAGGGLFIPGAVLAVWAVQTLGPALTPYPSPRPGTKLVDSGPFGHARHPIYGGVILAAAGMGVFAASWPALAAALALVPYFWAKSGHEEDLLADSVDGYAGYRTRVRRRLIPGLL